MRNDAHDDFDDVPSLKAGGRDDDDFAPAPGARVAAVRGKPRKPAATGPLWALVSSWFCGCYLLALGATSLCVFTTLWYSIQL